MQNFLLLTVLGLAASQWTQLDQDWPWLVMQNSQLTAVRTANHSMAESITHSAFGYCKCQSIFARGPTSAACFYKKHVDKQELIALCIPFNGNIITFIVLSGNKGSDGRDESEGTTAADPDNTNLPPPAKLLQDWARTPLPHVCPYCGKTFTRRVFLRTHVYSHTGEKLFTCKVPIGIKSKWGLS